jgi:hypothetical protein
MFEDIHRIDSTLLKPQQTNSKQQYKGSQKKRKGPESTGEEPVESEEKEGYETQEVPAEEPARRILDMQA